MQLDREGIDDSSQSTGVVDLKEHFLSNGLSNVAYKKLAKDIDNGDMNVDILCECDENELKMLAKDYKLTFLQQKAFVKAAKLLKNNKNSNNNKQQAQFIFVSPKDQNILNEMKEAGDKLKQFTNFNSKMKQENVSKISLLISQLKMYGDKFKESIDNIVNNIIKNVKF